MSSCVIKKPVSVKVFLMLNLRLDRELLTPNKIVFLLLGIMYPVWEIHFLFAKMDS